MGEGHAWELQTWPHRGVRGHPHCSHRGAGSAVGPRGRYTFGLNPVPGQRSHPCRGWWHFTARHHQTKEATDEETCLTYLLGLPGSKSSLGRTKGQKQRSSLTGTYYCIETHWRKQSCRHANLPPRTPSPPMVVQPGGGH